jgi:hypothetical protein
VVVGFAWWLDHLDVLIDGLRQAPLQSATDDDLPEPPPLRPFDIVITDPCWWADHPDNLEKALRDAVRSLGAG